MPRVYISPSTQQNNAGLSPFTNEENQMNAIVDVLMPLLIKDGRFITKRNLPSMDDVYSIAQDSNDFKADIHVAIHSNAGGGEGTEVMAYGPNTNSERLAKCLYNQVAPLSPGADRGVKYNPRLIEIGNCVNATATLIELAFHDNLTDAIWIAYNHEMIASALYKGICDFYGYDYKEQIPIPTPVVKASQYMIVNANPSLNVRQRPSTVAPIIGSLPNGKKVKIGFIKNGWANVYFGDHGGFVSTKYLK